MGALIMVAITLVAGVAVFGFVNAQAGQSANAIGNNAAANINFLNEREVITYVGFGGPININVMIYNNGQVDLVLKYIQVSGIFQTSGNPTLYNIFYYNDNSIKMLDQNGNLICTATASSSNENPLISATTIKTYKLSPSNSLVSFSLTIPSGGGCPTGISYKSGNVYTVSVLGQFGSMTSINVMKQ
jgi:hypothetical protein